VAGPIYRWLTTNTRDEKTGNPVSDLLRQCRKSFITVAILTLPITLLGITPLLYLWNLMDRVMASRSEATLISLTVLVLVAYAFWSALEWIRSRILIRISLRMDWDIAPRVFDTAFRRHVSRKKSNVHQIMGDVEKLRAFMTGSQMINVMGLPYVPLFILIGFLMHPWLGIYLIFAATVESLATLATTRATKPALLEASSAKSDADKLADQGVRHAETALALGMLPVVRKRWYQKHQRFLTMQANASEAAGLLGEVGNFLSKANMSMVFAVMIFLAIMGAVTPGMAIAAIFLLRMAISPITGIAKGWETIVLARQSLERLNDMVAEDDAEPERMALPRPKGHLKVETLIAQPQGAKTPVVFNFNFEAHPGEVIAVVGPSAAGKSSLLRLLAGIWIPNRGSARLDGADLSKLVRSDGGSALGFVPQEIEFFEATIAENIARLGDVNADAVVRAAQAAGVHEMILSFPDGYESMLGDSGQVLTGGQKQRLAIARALYGDPAYIVMDEPNANLDDAGERDLVEVVGRLKAKGCLVIFSTHRPNLIQAADKLLMVRDGQQAAFGTVAELTQLLKNPELLPDTSRSPRVAAAKPEAARAGPQSTQPQSHDPKPAASKPADSKPVDSKPVDSKPVDSKAADSKPVAPKPVQPQPVEPQVASAPTEPKPSDPPSPPVESALLPDLQKADALRAEARWAEALGIYLAAHAELPNNAPLAHNIALCMLALGRIGEAVEFSGKAHTADPDFWQAGFLHAKTLIVTFKDEQAQPILRELLAKYPDNADIRIELAASVWRTTKDSAVIDELLLPLRERSDLNDNLTLARLIKSMDGDKTQRKVVSK